MDPKIYHPLIIAKLTKIIRLKTIFKYIIYYSSITNPLILTSLESNLVICTKILSSCSSIDRIDHQTVASWAWDNSFGPSIIKVSTKACLSKDCFIISVDLISSSITAIIIHKNPKVHTYFKYFNIDTLRECIIRAFHPEEATAFVSNSTNSILPIFVFITKYFEG